MDEDFDEKVVKAIDKGITAFSCEIERVFRTYKHKACVIKAASTPIKHIHYDPISGYTNVEYKLEYAPEEIEFLEKVKSLSQENRKLVETYIEELSKK